MPNDSLHTLSRITHPSPDRPKRMATRDFVHAKTNDRKLSMVTCYDYTFASLLQKTEIDAILVGDSVAMVMHGYPTTLFADLSLMQIHTAAVVRGAPGKFIVSDMPFLSQI